MFLVGKRSSWVQQLRLHLPQTDTLVCSLYQSTRFVFFLFFYVRAAQCVLSVVTNCSSTLTWWLSIRSSPLRWKVTSPKADGGFGAERDPGLLTRGWRTWQEVESASQQLSKGEGDGWRARDVQRSAFRSLHGSSRKRKKKKASSTGRSKVGKLNHYYK